MGYELIITEKPKTALKIAQALADGKPIKKAYQGVPYYEITHGKTDIVVGCAVGHIFSLAEKNKGKWTYPVFDIEWKPSYEVAKGSEFTKKYVNTIKKISKDATSFTIATDYDIEGELIGLNVIRFACGQKDAARMKFSALTTPDLIKAYEKKSKHIDWGLANAGETRHEMDWYWGINISRALTLAIKTTGVFRVLSSGRVQGPALKIIVDKEKEIKAFKSEPYWQVELIGNASGGIIDAWHIEDKFFDKKKAEKVMQNVKGKKAFVKEVEKTEFKQLAPHPFDLTSLQIDAYRCTRISPKETLAIAQNLYTDGYISYPRTSSQKLPKEIGYKNIIKDISKQDDFKKECAILLGKKELIPHEGKKTDSAHPAIYPTGITPKALKEREKKIYDLIVHRFLATFGEPAIRLTVKITIDVNKELFVATGTTTAEKGWHELYGRFLMLKEEELPPVEKGQEVKVVEIKLLDKETQPPKRYTPASIIKELEKENLGTKATRAVIVDTLYNRGYVTGESIEATELGINTTETLEEFCPKILDQKLTRHFEEGMDEIQEGKKKPAEVLMEAKEVLTSILFEIKKKEKKIGEKLQEASRETTRLANIVGKCPKCKEGDLRVIKSRKSGKRFVACNKYPDCKTTFSLPQFGLVKAMKNVCKECGYPMVAIISKGKRPWQLCLNNECPTKKKAEETPKSSE
jgi:DNA topoisomerase-1